MARILALDYGERRIGVAVSDETGVIALPLCVILVRNQKQVLSEIQRICKENEIEKIVIGMPLNMSGTYGIQANNVFKFMEQIKNFLNIEVESWDERMTTQAAENALIDCNMSRKKRKQVIDKIAAQIVLQSYLDARDLI